MLSYCKLLIFNKMQQDGVKLQSQLFCMTIQGGAISSVLDFFVFCRFASLRAKRSNPDMKYMPGINLTLVLKPHPWIASSYLLAKTRSAYGQSPEFLNFKF